MVRYEIFIFLQNKTAELLKLDKLIIQIKFMGTKNNEKIKYFLYARKSSESEDRQVQSIDDQVGRLERLAKDRGFQIKHIYKESKSAKKPSNRPLFDEMMKRIESGEVNGILCWHLNRLSRNPIDSGKISWLLQQGVIKSIQTMEKEFRPEDNVLLFSVESGMANQFCRELSVNVKRGNQKKREDGWRPGIAPTGYINDLATHTMPIDPVRFRLLRKAWDLILTGNYTVPQVADKLNNEWGFRTIKKKRLGDKPLALSGMYKIFTNIFYAGIIEHNGTHYPGKHKAMITMDEFDRVQVILGHKGKPRPKKHHFTFTGIFRCPECGCMYTAETKTKHIKGTGKIKKYTYYHCTRRSRKIKCTQNKVLEESKLFEQLEYELEKYTIPQELLAWALEVIASRKETGADDERIISETRQQTLEKLKNQQSNLIRMRSNDMIDDEEFKIQSEPIKKEIERLGKEPMSAKDRKEKTLELTEKTFAFYAYAHKAFLTGSDETRRELIFHLGSNHAIKDQITNIQAKEWFLPIANRHDDIQREFERLEPMKSGSKKAKSEQFSPLLSTMHGV